MALDLPGHGVESDRRANLPETAVWIESQLRDEHFDLGGYSMGGRVALHVALRAPTRVRRLVLISTTRGIEDENERAQRRSADADRAQHLRTVGVAQFLDEWLALPLFATLPHDPLERSLRAHDAEGLASSLELAGTGTQAWLGERVHELTMPVLVIAGARDQKFVTEARELAAALPNAELAIAPNVGHAVQLEVPEWCARRVARFLAD